jgi:hypothetical protein
MSITAIPTQTDGSLGRIKSDADAATDLDTQLTAGEHNRLVTTVIALTSEVGLSDGTTAGSLNEAKLDHETRLGAVETAVGPVPTIISDVTALDVRVDALEAAGSASQTLWEWNRADTSQFSTPFATVTASHTLAVVNASHGPVLRLTFTTKTSGAGLAHVLRPDFDIPFVSGICRYRFRFRLAGTNANQTQWSAIGAAICNDLSGSSFYAISNVCPVASGVNAANNLRIQAGVLSIAGATPNWQTAWALSDPTAAANKFTLENTLKQSGAAPGWRAKWALESGYGTAMSRGSCNSDAQFIAATSSLGSGWDTASFKRTAIVVQGGSGAGAGDYFDFDEIAIERLVG